MTTDHPASDLQVLQWFVRLALHYSISVTPDGCVYRIVAVDGADEEVPTTEEQRAAIRRALEGET